MPSEIKKTQQNSFLTKTTIKDILPKINKLITVSLSDSTQNAFSALVQAKIASAPVIDNGNIKGFLDIAHFGKLILENPKTISSEFSKPISETIPSFLDVKTVKEGDELTTALSVLAKNHRVLVVNEKEEPIHVLTQGVFMEFLAKNVDKLEKLGLDNIDKLGLVKKKTIIYAKEDDLTIDVYRKILSNSISAVPVIGKGNRIIGNISLTDLKHIGNDFSLLQNSARKFIMHVLNQQLNDRVPAIYCMQKDTLRDVILKMNANRIHRIYVCNENHIPIGVISISDILRLLCYSLLFEQVSFVFGYI